MCRLSSKDGTRLASGSTDHTVRIWDPANAKLLLICQGHENWVTSVAWSQDGTRLASASNDNTVRIWDASSGRCLEVWHTFPDGGWVVLRSDGEKHSGNAAGLRRLKFADGLALYATKEFPELVEEVS